MLFLSVTEAGEAGALDLVSTTARNRRIFAWHETGLDLRVFSTVRRPDGRDEFSASCDTHVGRRWPPIPFTRRNKAVEQGFPPRGAGRPVMTATGLVVTDLSHLASDSTSGATSAGWFGLLCRASPVGQRARCDRDESVVSTCCAGSASAVSRVR
jgi:hypothetical protein